MNRSYIYNSFNSRFNFRPNATIGIIISWSFIYLLTIITQGLMNINAIKGNVILSFFALYPVKNFTIIYRIFTYGFLHGSLWHILANSIVLLFAGKEIEKMIGFKRFLILFFSSIIFCGLITAVYGYFVPWGKHLVIGGSGAVCTLLFLFWRLNPNATVLLFFVIPMPIKYAMYAAISIDAIGTILPLSTGMSHITHSAGYFLGFIYFKYSKYIYDFIENLKYKLNSQKLKRNASKKQKRNHYYTNEVDPILKKISEHGIESLTDIEKQILKNFKKF